MGGAKVQLKRIVKLMAWLHAVLGQLLPEFVGTVVVPRAQEGAARRRLERSALLEEVPVPQGRGVVHVTWQLRTA